MKKCFKFLMGLAVLFTMAACGMSVAQLEDEVVNLFNEKCEGTGVYATQITLVHLKDNEYKGLITITDGSDEETLDIKVVSDGRSFQYEIPDLL